MDRAGRGIQALDWLWVLAWAAVSAVWCASATRQLGPTVDEPFYVVGGLEYWRSGSHGALLKKGTMPLPIDLDTLPLYLWERWHGIQLDPVSGLEWLLPWARGGTLVFWWVLLVYGWLVGRRLAGPWGGRLAVALLACEPILLGHASLATTDIPVTACLLALVYHFRTGREASWVRRVGLPTVWFAASVLSKASGLLLGPLCLLAVEVERLARAGVLAAAPPSPGRWTWLRDGLNRLKPFRRDLVQIIGYGLVLVFLYCGSDWRQESSLVAWARSLPDRPTSRATVWFLEHLRIFPNAGEALVKQIRHNVRGHRPGAYLLGEERRIFWYYFPVALTMKLTLPLLAIPVVLAVVRPRALLNWAAVSALTLLLFSLTFRVQIGIRLVLPLIALWVVGLAAAVVQAGRESKPGWRRGALAAGVGAGIVWTATAAAAAWPHGLCYANELWGGTEQGYRYLSDSNCDWGQGLKDLARWHREQGLPPLDVWYFGTDPALRTLPFREVRFHTQPIEGPDDLAARVRGHYLAVSTTFLYGPVVTEHQKRAAAIVRAREPVARTTTFFIYDFTREQDRVQAGPAHQDARP